MSTWVERIDALYFERYQGLPLCKLSEDLRTYAELIGEARPEIIIELGGFMGGSALWFGDQLRDLEVSDPCVISIEIDTSRVRYADVLIEGSVTDPAIAEQVASIVGDRPVMVVEDSAHTYETTFAALELYAPLVKPGGFFIVEDTVVDDEELRLAEWPRGVQQALADWLPGQPFRVRDDFGRYGYTTNRGGLLERV